MDVDVESGIDVHNIEEDLKQAVDIKKIMPKVIPGPSNASKKPKNKFKNEEAKRKWEEMMTIKRRKLFSAIVKKEISKQQRAKTNKHKDMLLQLKRVAIQCQKVNRMKAVRLFT